MKHYIPLSPGRQRFSMMYSLFFQKTYVRRTVLPWTGTVRRSRFMGKRKKMAHGPQFRLQ